MIIVITTAVSIIIIIIIIKITTAISIIIISTLRSKSIRTKDKKIIHLKIYLPTKKTEVWKRKRIKKIINILTVTMAILVKSSVTLSAFLGTKGVLAINIS